MRRLVTLSAVALVFVAGCASDSNESSGGSTTAVVPATVPLNTTPPATLLATTPPGTLLAAAPPATSPSAIAPRTTTPPTTTGRPATSPPSTSPPQATTSPPSTASAGSRALTPAFVAFNVSTVSPCPAPGASAGSSPRNVVVSWEVIGTESVYVAIDNVDGPFSTGLPPAGSITLPNSCPNGNTYFVVAENAEGRTVQQATR